MLDINVNTSKRSGQVRKTSRPLDLRTLLTLTDVAFEVTCHLERSLRCSAMLQQAKKVGCGWMSERYM